MQRYSMLTLVLLYLSCPRCFLLVVFNGLKDLFVIHHLTSHLVSGESSCRTRGAQQRGTIGGHCRTTFRPNTIMSDSRRVWEHVSSIIIARVTCVHTWHSWYHRMLEPGKQLHVHLKCTLMLFLFHRDQLLYDFMQALTLLQCRSEDLMHKTHTNTHTDGHLHYGSRKNTFSYSFRFGGFEA